VSDDTTSQRVHSHAVAESALPKLVAVLSAAGALVALPATDWADSIVFVKDGDVWLANPDGSGQYQVTLDGTPNDPHESPSQADDGTIVAIRGNLVARAHLSHAP
jgi:hypothetical protein